MGFRKTELRKRFYKNRKIYVLLIPALIWYILFSYVPMGGLILAFKSYKANLGIWGSPFVGLANFKRLFSNPKFFTALKITLKINVGRLLITFPFSIILALLINEVRIGKGKKVYQWIFTFPHFLSWVVIASIATNVLSYDGMVNSIIKMMGGDYQKFLGNENFFAPLVYITEIWKTAGWNSIIYMAAISGIDTEQYEAADIDGAGRFVKMTRITLPSIAPTITIMFILATGNLMTTGFNQIFNLSNAAVQNVSQTLDMYIYNVTFRAVPDFGYSTAVSLFRSIVNLILLVFADKLSKKLGGNGLLG
jgi:putative aldouronate transport system permease protein